MDVPRAAGSGVTQGSFAFELPRFLPLQIPQTGGIALPVGSRPGATLAKPVPGSDSLRVRGRGTGWVWQIPGPVPNRVAPKLLPLGTT